MASGASPPPAYALGNSGGIVYISSDNNQKVLSAARNNGAYYATDPEFIALGDKTREVGLDMDAVLHNRPHDLATKLELVRAAVPENVTKGGKPPLDEFIASFQPSKSLSTRSIFPFDLPASIQEFTAQALAEIASKGAAATALVQNFKDSFASVVASAQDLRAILESRQIDLQSFAQQVAEKLADVEASLEAEFPELHGPFGHDERQALLRRVLGATENEVVLVCQTFGVSDEESRPRVQVLLGHLERGLTVVGDLVEQHPEVVEMILWSGLIAIVPESMILRPILSLFGFGPYGPAKRSVASWAQRYFWGGAVAKGSWFATLQRAGMTTTTWWNWWWKSIWIAIASVKIFG